MTTRSATSLLLATLLAIGCGSDADDDRDKPAGCEDAEMFVVFSDFDGDGYGDPTTQSEACELVDGLVEIGDDCNDDDDGTYPGAVELCDGADNNCDLQIDEGLNLTTFYADGDNDGFGDPEGSTTTACDAPAGYASNVDDCDDSDPNNFPNNDEVCDGTDNDCDGRIDDQDPILASGTTTYYADADNDGFGDPAKTRDACQQPNNYVTNDEDCNDAAAAVFPGAVEVCNNDVDDNCDTLADDDDPALDTSTWLTWYEDLDGDSLGNPDTSVEQCARPADHVANPNDCDDDDAQVGAAAPWRLDADGDGIGAGMPVQACEAPVDHVFANLGSDCDDTDPQVFPGQLEVCNTVDDDCDSLVDDADNNLDLSTADLYHPDTDGDGYGNGNVDLYRCVQPPTAVVDASDCDDSRASVNPNGVEVCDNLDNDCNGQTDDEDPNVDPNDFIVWFPDVDEDGYGDLVGAVESCHPPAGYIADGTDCNDLDPTLGEPPLWYVDGDNDGHGVGLPVFGPSCTAPAGLAPGSVGEDCDDSDEFVSPSEEEICEDGIDNDCDGIDLTCPLPASCYEYVEDEGATTDGIYTIEPVPYMGQFDVYCDNTVEGGGWTLVGSSFNRPLSDQAGAYHPGLTTLEPTGQMAAIWDGLKAPLAGEVVDVRFACKEFVTDPFFTVDLVVYDVDWYQQFVTGTDAQSCFSEGDGAGYDQVPMRLDVLTNTLLPAGDDWNSGVLEGEDSCADSDFSIDFDDRGVDGDPDDGTDWGFANGLEKCGVSGAGEAWFLFVRLGQPLD